MAVKVSLSILKKKLVMGTKNKLIDGFFFGHVFFHTHTDAEQSEWAWTNIRHTRPTDGRTDRAMTGPFHYCRHTQEKK